MPDKPETILTSERTDDNIYFFSKSESGSIYSQGDHDSGMEAVGRSRCRWEIPPAPVLGRLCTQRRVPDGIWPGNSAKGRDQAGSGRFGQGGSLDVAAGARRKAVAPRF